MNWQSIDTSPDNEEVLAFWPSGNDGNGCIGVAYKNAGTWFDCVTDLDEIPPTHWMPLPEFPK